MVYSRRRFMTIATLPLLLSIGATLILLPLISPPGDLLATQLPTQSPDGQREPLSIVTGPDGALWFTENPGAKIGRITTDGATTEFVLPAAGSETEFNTPFGS